jgi:hypothetical protein
VGDDLSHDDVVEKAVVGIERTGGMASRWAVQLEQRQFGIWLDCWNIVDQRSGPA